MMNRPARHFLSCDWGTSSFRLRLVDREGGRILEEIVSDGGVKPIRDGLGDGVLAGGRSRAFEDYLSRQVAALGFVGETGPVVVSGMASSTIGWEELPYAGVPFPVDGSAARVRWLECERGGGGRLPVLLVSGLATEDDIMRGEETQLIGLLAMPEHEKLREGVVVVLPGTHSKHIYVRDGGVTGFRTYLTGELFAVLCRHSILRFTTGGGEESFDSEAFHEGVESGRKEGMLRSLFRVRTRSVLGARSDASNRSFLTGLLLGTEWLDLRDAGERMPVLLAGAGGLARQYELAAEATGLKDRLIVVGEGVFNRAVVTGHSRLLDLFERRA